MNIKKTLVYGAIGVTAGIPLALQLVAPTAASARAFPVGITSVSPASGPASGGTAVVITGVSLTLASGVLFGNVAASYTIVSAGEIIAISPPEPAGTVVVQIQNETVRSTADFTYS